VYSSTWLSAAAAIIPPRPPRAVHAAAAPPADRNCLRVTVAIGSSPSLVTFVQVACQQVVQHSETRRQKLLPRVQARKRAVQNSRVGAICRCEASGLDYVSGCLAVSRKLSVAMIDTAAAAMIKDAPYLLVAAGRASYPVAVRRHAAGPMRSMRWGSRGSRPRSGRQRRNYPMSRRKSCANCRDCATGFRTILRAV
jgi:hypothetical protein